MDAVTASLMPIVTEHLLVPVVAATATAIIGLIGYTAGAAKRALDAFATKSQATTHALDMARLTEAMERKAIAAVADTSTPAPTPEQIIDYLGRVRPDLLNKMRPPAEALETMAQAAIAQAEVAVSPPDVLLPSRP